MDKLPNQSPNPQAIEPAANGAGRARVKPRQLSPILRQVIVDRFAACHSTEDIAEELRIPARTVTDVVLVAALRKPEKPEGHPLPFLARRSA